MPTGLCDDSSISWYKVKYQVNCGKAWWGTMGNAWALIYIKSKSMPDAAICHLVACSVLFSHHRIGVLAWSTCHLLPRLCRVWEDFYSATISVSLAVRRWIWFSKNRLSRSDWVKKKCILGVLAMPTFPTYFGMSGDPAYMAQVKGDVVSLLQAGCCAGALLINFFAGKSLYAMTSL